ncbi:MAG TPA: uroporphyrinogen-III decarboxylase-like protein [Phycisphaerales bacterium]|nr:uroporphyrinogen-III decarboxylase-like protein [Phycisphaerales bacterium]|tara:strand:+ start:54196 stop:55239 length:1044 start_codon:yes stop_codon:yes gene_type:complete
MMTPRERWHALFNKQTPDRIPTDYQSTGEVTQRLVTDLCCKDENEVWRQLHIDKRKGANANRINDLPQDTDIWGVTYRTVDYGTGSYREASTHPLAHMTTVAEIEAYDWPSADDFDFSKVRSALESYNSEYPTCVGGFEPFLIYANLRGLELGFEDLLLEPEIADAILTHLFEFHFEYNLRLYEAGKGLVDVTYIAEDLGSQTGPLMGLETYRRFLLPNQIKMANLARSYGIHIMYHTDGAARIFLPDLIDKVGIELLNPIQWKCPGMEREGLVRDFGKDIIFHGSIDNQDTLPFGTVQEVIDEVKESIDIYSSTRWICSPCHNIQPVSPTENIVAMYETIHEYGLL